jgi:hypothetical protein
MLQLPLAQCPGTVSANHPVGGFLAPPPGRIGMPMHNQITASLGWAHRLVAHRLVASRSSSPRARCNVPWDLMPLLSDPLSLPAGLASPETVGA